MSNATFFQSSGDFRKWLESNAESHTELLVGYYKVSSKKPSMSWSESVDEALCYGWIDGVRRRIDDESYLIRFTPRKRTSIWSSVNIAKVEQLRKEGKMTAAGENAFANRTEEKSSIYAHEQTEAAALSAFEEKEFRRHKKAWNYFESTPPGYKKTVLHWVLSAKKIETRQSRLSKLIDASDRGVRMGW